MSEDSVQLLKRILEEVQAIRRSVAPTEEEDLEDERAAKKVSRC